MPATGHSQVVVAMVDGEPITALDIEQRSKFMQMSTQKVPARQEVIDSLINEILEIREAKKFGIDVPQSEVDERLRQCRHPHGRRHAKTERNPDKRRGEPRNPQASRSGLSIAWSALVRGRYKASLEVADTDVEAQLQLHKPDDKNEVGYEYALRPILLVVPRGAPDAAFEARKRDADALRVRFESCADGIAFARALREVAVREPITKYSADLLPALRDILDKTDIGHLTPPEQTAEGIQMFALCSKKEIKDRYARQEGNA